MIKEVLNDEQVLELCLFKELNSPNGDENACKAIIAYIISQHPEGLEEDEIEQKLKEMLVSYLITNMCKKGLVEANFDDGEVRYSITDYGKQSLQESDPY